MRDGDILVVEVPGTPEPFLMSGLAVRLALFPLRVLRVFMEEPGAGSPRGPDE